MNVGFVLHGVGYGHFEFGLCSFLYRRGCSRVQYFAYAQRTQCINKFSGVKGQMFFLLLSYQVERKRREAIACLITSCL